VRELCAERATAQIIVLRALLVNLLQRGDERPRAKRVGRRPIGREFGHTACGEAEEVRDTLHARAARNEHTRDGLERALVAHRTRRVLLVRRVLGIRLRLRAGRTTTRARFGLAAPLLVLDLVRAREQRLTGTVHATQASGGDGDMHVARHIAVLEVAHFMREHRFELSFAQRVDEA